MDNLALYRRYRRQQQRERMWVNIGGRMRRVADVTSQQITPREAAEGIALAVGAEGAINTVSHLRHTPKKRKVETDKVTPTQPSDRVQLPKGMSPAVDKVLHRDDPEEPTPMAAAPMPAAALGRQTELTPIPRHIKPGIPEYFTTKIVHSVRLRWTTTANARDQLHNLAINNLAINSNYTSDAQHQKGNGPRWLTYFKDRYDYYCVLKNEFQITFFIPGQKEVVANDNEDGTTTADNTISSDFFVYEYDKGTDDISSVNFPEHIGEVLMVDRHLLRRPTQFETEYLQINRVKTYKDYHDNVTEIKTDALDNIWTAVAADPGIGFQTKFILKSATISKSGQIFAFVRTIKTVQFKEAKEAYKWHGQN